MLRNCLPLSIILFLLAKDVKHVLTHRILLADFYLQETETRPLLPDDYIWVKEDEDRTVWCSKIDRNHVGNGSS